MRELYLYLKIFFVLTSCSADRVVFRFKSQNECKRGKTKTGRKKEKEKAN